MTSSNVCNDGKEKIAKTKKQNTFIKVLYLTLIQSIDRM